MHRFRVFVSYDRQDRDLSQKLKEKLEARGLEVFRDDTIGFGALFSDEIKDLIARSHCFLPLITQASKNSTWVYLETGYAVSLNIPIIPIVIRGTEKDLHEPLSSLNAMIVDDDFADINNIEEEQLNRIITPARPVSVFEIMQWPETRTDLLVKRADRALDAGNYGTIRQKAAFSTFYLPSSDFDRDLWEKMSGTNPRSDYYQYLLSQERRSLGQHIERSKDDTTCKLIIDPSIKLPYCGTEAAKLRLQSLLEFLRDDKFHNKTEIVISSSAKRHHLTIVGDFFSAESHIPSPQGYRNTIFHFHPPTVYRILRQFDQEFDELYKSQFIGGKTPKENAIDAIQKEIDGE